jgi:hypothetical protein
MKDLISDVKLGLGISREDKQFIRRTNQMKNYIKDNTGEHHIMGHPWRFHRHKYDGQE